MSDNVTPIKERTLTDIQNEYGQICTLVGQAHYQIYALELDIKAMNEKLKELNAEAFKMKEKEDAAKKEQEAK
jgi:hypothetical protein